MHRSHSSFFWKLIFKINDIRMSFLTIGMKLMACKTCQLIIMEKITYEYTK